MRRERAHGRVGCSGPDSEEVTAEIKDVMQM